MAQCPQCYTGTCRRHVRQDHGRSVAQPADAKATFNKMYDLLVGSKLKKLQQEADLDSATREAAAFREQLDAAR
ncbi:TPA: hypothetical protein N0F65_012062, partial [Lagenidium giganteum]